ncbi:MAG: KH domain-containing protein [Desulfobacterales bacterium]|nr:KH domain-containing protein [Desulfobacterales bacterium]
MKELVEIMARSLVDQPAAVSVTEIGGAHSSILELKVAKEDIGKIIGKQGRTADAMRTIIGAVAAKMHKRSVLEVIG